MFGGETRQKTTTRIDLLDGRIITKKDLNKMVWYCVDSVGKSKSL
jgi:hypothetical protein